MSGISIVLFYAIQYQQTIGLNPQGNRIYVLGLYSIKLSDEFTIISQYMSICIAFLYYIIISVLLYTSISELSINEFDRFQNTYPAVCYLKCIMDYWRFSSLQSVFIHVSTLLGVNSVLGMAVDANLINTAYMLYLHYSISR